MDKKKVSEFFDKCAPSWDAELIRSDRIIAAILDAGGIGEGVSVLDVACGTGVLFPDYLKRNVASVIGVDISPEMVKLAAGKFPDPRIKVLLGDAETMELSGPFDAVMIYNAFPHFPQPELLLLRLAGCLGKGGRLTVAHGMSREAIDAHHHGCADQVSVGLMDAGELAGMMAPFLDVDVVISDDEKYIVSGKKR